MDHDRTSKDETPSPTEPAFAPTQVSENSNASVHKTWSVVSHLNQKLGTTVRLRLFAESEEPAIEESLGEVGSSPQSAGHYEIRGQIAEGGMGTVFRGRDYDLGREVALKFLKPEHRNSPLMAKRFVDEAQIGGQLQHPGILPVYELGLDPEGCPFFAMKLIHGKTLQELIIESDLVADRARLVALMEKICHAVAYAHARGVIHRDLKPSNVMIGRFGEVQVVDWGLAKVVTGGAAPAGEDSSAKPDDLERANSDMVVGSEAKVTTERSGSNLELSAVGAVMGTPLYMSPEQARGELDRLDRRSDVFALGAMLCELLTGHPLYQGNFTNVIQSAIEGNTSLAIRRLDEAMVDDELKAIVKRCIEIDPDDRFRDAGMLGTELENYSNSVGDRAWQAEISAARSEAKAQSERRAKWLTALLALVVIAGILTAATVFGLIQKADRDRLDQASQAVESAINRASQNLGQAFVAEHGHHEPWIQLETAAEHLQTTLDNVEVHDETKSRAQDLLIQIDQAHRNHDFLDRIERITINRLPDGESSWILMEREMREAFVDYGIDLENHAPSRIQNTISSSQMSVEFAHALDLWVRARFVVFHDPKIFSDWLSVIYAADPDPWRVSIRQLTFAPTVTLDQVQEIENRIVPEKANALTYYYLLSAYSRVPNSDAWLPLIKRAQLLFPDDFLLHYSEGVGMMQLTRHAEAVQAFRTAAALRPNASGVWQALGQALLLSDNEQEAIPVLEKALSLEVSSATLVRYANVLEASERIDEARQQFVKVMELTDDYPIGFREYGSFLTRRSEFEEAEHWLEKYLAACQRIEDELNASSFAGDQELADAKGLRAAAEKLLQTCRNRESIPESYR